MICGVLAEGRRATQIIRKDEVGRDEHPTTISEEWWFSRDLQAMVSYIFNDSHRTVTLELTDIERKEPGSKLFMAPPGYEVVAKPMRQLAA